MLLKPEISVIIPAYNSQDSISRAIDSILVQTFKNWELIIVDDGSIDQTRDLLQTFLHDTRIKYFYQENAGVCSARNRGGKVAKGDWLVFLDADDELSEDALRSFNDAISSDRLRNVWVAGVKRISSGNIKVVLPKGDENTNKLVGTFCIRKNLFDCLEGFDEKLKYSENTEFFYRVNLKDVLIGYIQKVTLLYHQTEFGGSRNLQNMINSLIYILDKHQETLSSQIKHVNHQIIGVNYMRFQKYSLARKHLWKSLYYKPLGIDTSLRLLIACLPPVARIFYPEKVVYK